MLVKSELAVTSVIRLAKISDAFVALRRTGKLRRVAVPNARERHRSDAGRWLSSRCESVSRSFVSECKKQNKQAQGSVLSFPLFRPFKVCQPPAETKVLRTRREAPARRRHKHGSYAVAQGM